MSQKPAKKSFFSRPFRIFLWFALPLTIILGALVWAIKSDGIPVECKRTNKVSILHICDRLRPKGHFEGKDVRTVDVPPADTNLGTDHDSTISGLDIQVTNHTDKEYFVPFRTQKELASFAQWANTVKRVKDPSGRPKYVSSGVELCVKDKAVTDTTKIKDGGYSADVVGCGLACTVTEIRGQRCAAKANVTDWEVITQTPQLVRACSSYPFGNEGDCHVIRSSFLAMTICDSETKTKGSELTRL